MKQYIQRRDSLSRSLLHSTVCWGYIRPSKTVAFTSTVVPFGNLYLMQRMPISMRIHSCIAMISHIPGTTEGTAKSVGCRITIRMTSMNFTNGDH